jgi:hypothetical protein
MIVGSEYVELNGISATAVEAAIAIPPKTAHLCGPRDDSLPND